MNTNANTVSAIELARRIAKELGHGWKVQSHSNDDSGGSTFCTMYGPENEEIAVDMRPGATAKGRLELRGVLPRRDSKGSYIDTGKSPSITVDPNRQPDAIAADMRRRLLPAYAIAFAKAVDHLKGCNEYISQTAANQATLRAAGGKLVSGSPSDNSKLYLYGENASGTVTAHGDSVSVELRSLSVETAAEILRLIRKLDA